jgi:hypothetical protein
MAELWAENKPLSGIADELGVSRSLVAGQVSRARSRGDDRFKPRPAHAEATASADHGEVGARHVAVVGLAAWPMPIPCQRPATWREVSLLRGISLASWRKLLHQSRVVCEPEVTRQLFCEAARGRASSSLQRFFAVGPARRFVLHLFRLAR